MAYYYITICDTPDGKVCAKLNSIGTTDDVQTPAGELVSRVRDCIANPPQPRASPLLLPAPSPN